MAARLFWPYWRVPTAHTARWDEVLLYAEAVVVCANVGGYLDTKLSVLVAGIMCTFDSLSESRCFRRLRSNVFPHSTFNWIGIDGTQVLCHMTPVGTLFSCVHYPHILTICCRHIYRTGHRRRRQPWHREPQGTYADGQQVDVNECIVFGNGDGGGGPLSKMLENVCTFDPFLRGRC